MCLLQRLQGLLLRLLPALAAVVVSSSGAALVRAVPVMCLASNGLLLRLLSALVAALVSSSGAALVRAAFCRVPRAQFGAPSSAAWEAAQFL